MRDVAAEARAEYASADPLRLRIETHRRYSVPPDDLDGACLAFFRLAGDEAVADVGCGSGQWLRYLRAHGHRGPLVGVDRSAAMLAEAAAAGGSAARWVEADVQSLPFPDGKLDAVSARHMLYHVADIPQALAELRRVVRPGGPILVTTNDERSLPGIAGLTADAFAAHGLVAAERISSRFSAETAPPLLAAAGLAVEERRIEGALVFSEPEPIAAYAASNLTLRGAPAEPELRRRMVAWLAAEASRRLAAAGGTWRDPKASLLYRCTAP